MNSSKNSVAPRAADAMKPIITRTMAAITGTSQALAKFLLLTFFADEASMILKTKPATGMQKSTDNAIYPMGEMGLTSLGKAFKSRLNMFFLLLIL